MTTEADLRRAIEENPTDFDRFGVYADWLEENGREAHIVYCWRWMELHQSFPQKIESGPEAGHWRWASWITKTENEPHQLPQFIYDALRYDPYYSCVVTANTVEYKTLEIAVGSLAFLLRHIINVVALTNRCGRK